MILHESTRPAPAADNPHPSKKPRKPAELCRTDATQYHEAIRDLAAAARDMQVAGLHAEAEATRVRLRILLGIEDSTEHCKEQRS